MNKTLRYALGAVLTAGMILPAIAQDNFPDVPDNHWAYEALETMKKEGLLVGYPDGLFRGGRPATRYELAVAVHATYAHLKGITDSLQSQIDALKGQIPTGGGDFASKADLQALKDQLAALQSDVNGMKGWGDDIANLKKMAATFEKELSSLGVDVEAMKKDLSDLAARVGVLEKNKLPITVHGDVNLLMMGGASDSHRPGIDLTGRPVGVQGATGGGTALAGFSQDLSIYHEAGIRIAGNNETGPQWHATLVVGNMLGASSTGAGLIKSPFPSQSTTGNHLTGYSEGAETVYFQDFAVKFATSLASQNFTAELGRTGYSIDPYIFQRPDVTPYFANDRWDDGKWMMDGGILGFNFGSAKFDVFGGRNSSQLTTGFAGQIQPMEVGQIGFAQGPGGGIARPIGLTQNQTNMDVNQSLGFNLAVPLTENGKLDLAYIFLEANDNDAIHAGFQRFANRAQVFGGDLKWNFGAVKLDGGYSQSNLYNGKQTVVSRDNAAWHVNAAYDADRWGVGVGYKEIDPQFGAPGDWGRIGIWWNPTDIKGVDANAHFNLTDALKISAGAEWLSGTGRDAKNNLTAAQSTALGVNSTFGLGTDDKITRYTIDLNYKLNDAWSAMLGFEAVDWDLQSRANGFVGGKPRERWYNVGLGYNLSDMARLSFLWQISDYNGAGNGGADIGWNPFLPGASNTKATGNLITTQLTIKF